MFLSSLNVGFMKGLFNVFTVTTVCLTSHDFAKKHSFSMLSVTVTINNENASKFTAGNAQLLVQ